MLLGATRVNLTFHLKILSSIGTALLKRQRVPLSRAAAAAHVPDPIALAGCHNGEQVIDEDTRRGVAVEDVGCLGSFGFARGLKGFLLGTRTRIAI